MPIRFNLQPVGPNAIIATNEKLASNAAALLMDDFIVAVDATMRPDTSQTFRNMLEEQYHRPVKYLCVTHYHADHVFGLKSFKDVSMFASSLIAENMRQSPDWDPQSLAERKKNDPNSQEWLDEVEFIIPPLLFHQRMDLCGPNNTIEFYHSGGHTSCSVFGYAPKNGTLFAGDLIFAGRFPYAGDGTCDPEKWIATLKSWLNMEISRILPGHGPVTDINEIKLYLELFETLKANTLNTLDNGQTYHDIAVPAVYPLGERDQWFVDRTKKHWFEYYRQANQAGGIQIV